MDADVHDHFFGGHTNGKVAGKCVGKIVAPGEYPKHTDHKLFELWFCDALLKEVSPGSFIILDNATFHRKKALAALAPNSGFVFNQVHNVMGNVRPENIVAMLDTAYEESFKYGTLNE